MSLKAYVPLLITAAAAVAFLSGCEYKKNTPTYTSTPPPIVQPSNTPFQPEYTSTLENIITATPFPTATSTPTITPTPACVDSIIYKGLAYLPNNVSQISFDTGVDLRDYRLLDANNKPTTELVIPGLKVYVNGVETDNYKAFMYDPNRTDRLYLVGPISGILRLELSQDGSRLCSKDTKIPTQAPTQAVTPTVPSNGGGGGSPTEPECPPGQIWFSEYGKCCDITGCQGN